MRKLLEKYVHKLVSQGLCNSNEPVIGGLDAELTWNKLSTKNNLLEEIINNLSINSILFSKPAEPYASIINYLSTKTEDSTIYPQDCETRTFLHDIPVVVDIKASNIIKALKNRKAVIIPNQGIIAYGTISPEQAFISYSSICFACFVKFFTDYYKNVIMEENNAEQDKIFSNAFDIYNNFINNIKDITLDMGPFDNKKSAIKGLSQAGKLLIDCRLVDSFFGNISYKLNNTIYISQTTSSLDELAGYIDPCPLDNSSCNALTASSELSAHKAILSNSDNLAILHGHPKFSVIMSMLCDDENKCVTYGKCHIKCPKTRVIKDIPIISGEVGTGKYGLSKTLPPAMKNRRGVIVYGHGLFTIGKHDFIDAFNNLLDIEKICIKKYSKSIKNNLILSLIYYSIHYILLTLPVSYNTINCQWGV